MSCITDIQCGNRIIIGIKDFDACAKPESGLFINDIPGITLKNAAGVTNEEHISGFKFLQDLIKRAIQLTFEDFYAEASPKFQLNAINETREVHYFSNNTLPFYAGSRGLVLKRWRSEMARIYVDTVFVKSATSGAIVINIIDGVNTIPFTATVVANQELPVKIDYIAESESIRIEMDNSAQAVFTGDIQNLYTNCNSCYGMASGGFFVTGWNGTAEIQKYFGLGVLASVRCYEENLLCQLLKRMSFLFWYRAGMMYYDELLSSNRLNNITIFSKERAAENLADLTEKYNLAYKNFLPIITTFIRSTKSECFTCNPSVKYANTIP